MESDQNKHQIIMLEIVIIFFFYVVCPEKTPWLV